MNVTFREEDHTYWSDGVRLPSVSEILEVSGLREPYTGDPIYGQRGTYVHKATELLDEDDLDWERVKPEWEGYVRAYEKFRHDNPSLEILGREEIVGHEQYRYAGTLDLRCLLNGRKTIIDLKTGSPNRSHMVQCAGYALPFPDKKPYQLRVLYLQANGVPSLKGNAKEEIVARQIWMAGLTIYYWKT